jgi:hypothetical protein
VTLTRGAYLLMLAGMGLPQHPTPDTGASGLPQGVGQPQRAEVAWRPASVAPALQRTVAPWSPGVSTGGSDGAGTPCRGRTATHLLVHGHVADVYADAHAV